MLNTIVFFNNKGGVGKTTSIYHIAWMLAELEHKVLVLDLDPQCNLSSMFLTEERLTEAINEPSLTILNTIEPILDGEPQKKVHIEYINENISLLIGDLRLSALEDKLATSWAQCHAKDYLAFKICSVFQSVIQEASKIVKADYILIDIGPNLGAINRSILISTNFLIVPVAPDLFSLQGIKNIGMTINEWRKEWESNIKEKFPENKDKSVIATGKMLPLGYIISQYSAKENKPVIAYSRWSEKIPKTYTEHILKKEFVEKENNDPNQIGYIRHFHSLAPLSQEARKPMFLLKPADGAVGSHAEAVLQCYKTFEDLSYRIIGRINEAKQNL